MKTLSKKVFNMAEGVQENDLTQNKRIFKIEQTDDYAQICSNIVNSRDRKKCECLCCDFLLFAS